MSEQTRRGIFGKLLDKFKEPTPYQTNILVGLNKKGHMYAGLADRKKVERRRKANRVARRQRKVNAHG
jgi:hypothetical protein